MYPTISDAAAALRTRETTSVELTRSALAAADAHDSVLGVYLARFDTTALDAAARADAELAAGTDRGPLHGIPLGIKDIIAAEEGDTTAQSRVLDREWGARRDATVVSRLRAAGAVITGKTTTMEYAVGAPDGDQPFPTPRNPWNLDRYSGGSTSGTAAGIAAGLFLGGLGTDTGGSIRSPATACGVSGLKPTFGLVPKNGCVPLGYSFDHIGPLARSAADCGSILHAIAGYEPRDASSVDRPVGDYRPTGTDSLAGVRIGVDPLLTSSPVTVDELEETLQAAVDELAAAGAVIVPIELPLYDELKSATMVGLAAEGFAYHRPDLRTRWSDYGAHTRLSLAIGALLSSGDYVQAQRVRLVGQRRAAELFRELDLIVTPTAARGALPVDGIDLDMLVEMAHTHYWSALGNPALSVPMGFTRDGLPLGLQIAGRPFRDADVIAAGRAYQRLTDWHLRVPPISTRPPGGPIAERMTLHGR